MGLGGLLARPSRLPSRRPSHELLLLALVAFVALSPVNHASDPDASRLCLSRAMVHGRLTISPCIGESVDWSHYDGDLDPVRGSGQATLARPLGQQR
jgi:hypothetical protein